MSSSANVFNIMADSTVELSVENEPRKNKTREFYETVSGKWKAELMKKI